jgi:ornithine cyclodeaminase/alanine dehydrogenase-like protein (mu-crystallin family)
MQDAVRVMKDVYRELSSGRACVPPRTRLDIGGHGADALLMPAYSPALDRLGVKVVTLHPTNPGRGLPFIQALVLLLDAANGNPLAVMNGTTLTAIRTGAASGAATDVLARRNASRAAIFGAGTQAETQLEAICAVRAIRGARVFDVSAQRARAFAARMTETLRIEVAPAGSPAEALAGADVVCTATTSAAPVFADADLASGTHINAVGSYKPDVREIPGATVGRARVFVDQIEAAWHEAGDLIMARNDGALAGPDSAIELGQVLAGERPGREHDGQITFFKSVGIASQDLAAAQAVLENGIRMGLGATVPL